MIDLEDELAEEYLAECRECTSAARADLLAARKGRAEMTGELVNRLLHAVHLVRGAGLFGMVKARELALAMEDVLGLLHSGKMAPTPHRVGVLLRAAESLHELVRRPAASNRADTSEAVAGLVRLCEDHRDSAGERRRTGKVHTARDPVQLRILLVEDDFASRLVLQTFLSRYGECHIAVNGKEAVDAFRSAMEAGKKYALVCMDIMMPEMDGREAVRQVRALEEAHGILSTFGAKIVMTTAVDDVKEVIRCFRELCDGYLLKPIDLAKLLGQMKSLGLAG
jgi:two-component system chemotaxis response regulator CheY